MQDKKVELSLTLVNAVLQYLGTRPYQEIFQLVQAIQGEAGPQVQPEQEAAALND